MENIHIIDPETLELKIKKLKQHGPSKLHLISDFDMTLTTASLAKSGLPAATSFSALESNLPPEYAKEVYELYVKYHTIETANNILQEQKDLAMEEWWLKALEIMKNYKLNKNLLDKVIKSNGIKEREGVLEFFNIAYKKDIPLLILSAGVGDIISGYINEKGFSFNGNVHIISNFYKFDSEGNVEGYISDLIHPFNKNKSKIRGNIFYDKVIERKNLILLGDSLGDAKMEEGMEHDTVLKIGFLNSRIEELFSHYSKLFDVLILNDGPMHYVNSLLKEICQ